MGSYSEHLPPDFRVSYGLFSDEEGGRKALPLQHIRWNFAYEDEEISPPDKVFMIWPEFIASSGGMLPEGEPIPSHGLANMFILNPAFREFHCQHLKLGIRGYFREGGRRTGWCEVVKVLGLHQNPMS
jgi:hypothetical protein